MIKHFILIVFEFIRSSVLLLNSAQSDIQNDRGT
jgi:hypothetical protein